MNKKTPHNHVAMGVQKIKYKEIRTEFQKFNIDIIITERNKRVKQGVDGVK